MKKILFGYRFDKEGFQILEENFELIYPETQYFSRQEMIDLIQDVDVLVPNFGYSTDKEIIDKGEKLQLIANFGVGYDNIDVEYAASKGIAVTNTPNSVLEPTAELCFALILAAARRIRFYDSTLRSENGLRWGLYNDLGTMLHGKTLGIFGMGRIGRAVARRAVASGMKIIYHNRSRIDKSIEKKYEARYVDFDSLLKESDIISINAPATSETFHIFNGETFGKMKPDSILVNVARGSLVDEQALAEALKSGIIGSAGLDVFENEPKISRELLELENIVLTPHAGTKTVESRKEMQHEVSQNIIGFFEGKPVSRVN
jgi:lactate dehydrogenase-like 2-hydroxyacid dehydrogenase